MLSVRQMESLASIRISLTLVIDEFTSLLLEDLSIAETRAIFEDEMAIDTFIEKLKNDIKDIDKISNKDILYAVIPLVIDNLKIQKEQYGKDPESTIVIPRPDSRRYTSIGKASHLWGDKKSRPSEAKSRVYEDSRGGEGSQKEAVDSRYSIPDPDPSEAFYECKCNKCCSNLLNSTYILFLPVLVIRSCSRYRPLE